MVTATADKAREAGLMPWYVYLLRCKDGSLYTGIATDPLDRFKRHRAGRGSKYVRSKGAVELVHLEAYPDTATAKKRECEIKGWTRHKKLALVAGGRKTQAP